MATRAPSKPLKLTDDELREFTQLDILTAEQRAIRRKLRRYAARDKSQANAKAREKAGIPKPLKYCSARKKDGSPCGGYALADSGMCMSHQPKEVRELMGFGTPGPSKRKQTGPELSRLVFEAATAEWIKPYMDAVGLKLVGFDTETGDPVIERKDGRAGLGIVLHGESKDGVIKLTNHPNVTAQVSVIEKLQDRIYGKPRQTTVLEGGDRPIRVEPVRTEERAQKVAALLARSGAIPPISTAPHDGRQRRTPAKPTED